MAPAAVPLLTLLDHRNPGQPMATLPLKVPAAAVDQLQALADRMHKSRGAVARALLLRGLTELEQADAAQRVA